LAARTAEVVQDGDGFRYMEVDPHALVGSALGKSQRAVTELFRSTLVERAMRSATIVLLDEVETLVADRTKMSLEANPIDVHRATDAALVQLDRLAEDHGRLLFIATSNFPSAIDRAFTSRADLVVNIPLPNEDARLAILRNTLAGMATEFPRLQELTASPDLVDVARATEGLDGRAVRKLVAAGCAEDTDVALEPERLTIGHLLAAVRAMTATSLGGKAP
jgi:AAA+ superfamily predicted ATPase